ncbi:MAG: glutaredoxin family protein [Gammaproteobacteria bacterium]
MRGRDARSRPRGRGHRWRAGLWLGWLIALTAPCLADSDAAPRVLEVFSRAGCPHCAAAAAYLAKAGPAWTDVRIVHHAVDRDPQARARLVEWSRRSGQWPPGVPTFVRDGRVLVGFEDSPAGHARLAAFVNGGDPGTDALRTRVWGELSVERLGLPLFALALGLIDGFNPCAMWVLLFLLSLLVRLRDRRRLALIGGTFVLASGAVYFAFMATWLNLFLAIGLSDPLRDLLAGIALLIGVLNVKDFVAFGHGPSLAIPASRRPGLYVRMRALLETRALAASMVSVAILAILVNFVELLCTAGLPAMFTAILAQHPLSPTVRYGYLGLYILGFMADDALMVGTATFALSSGRLGERGARRLKLLSGVVMLSLGAVMLVRPEWLF